MRYTFRCSLHGHYEGLAPPDDIWATCPECGVPYTRDLHADLVTQSIDTGDPFRKYHLSTAKERAAQAQGREIGGPKDNFERRLLEKTLGRKYIGDDASGLSAKGQRALEKGRRREFAYQHDKIE